MESDYVLTTVDIELKFFEQVYDMIGVGYMVNGNHFISRFIDRTTSVPTMWEANGMHRDGDTKRRGRCVQLSTNGKPVENWFLALPPAEKYSRINANMAFYAKRNPI
jgi:hypothetical protein